MSDEPSTWPTSVDGVPCLPLRRPITEDWLRRNGFRIEDGRADARHPMRSLTIGDHLAGGRTFMGSHDDLCIDVAPVDAHRRDLWFCWVAQREPYRHIHVRHMRETHEIVALYQGLTGRVWPGEL